MRRPLAEVGVHMGALDRQGNIVRQCAQDAQVKFVDGAGFVVLHIQNAQHPIFHLEWDGDFCTRFR